MNPFFEQDFRTQRNKDTSVVRKRASREVVFFFSATHPFSRDFQSSRGMYIIRAASELFCSGWNAFVSNSEKLKRQSEVNVWKLPFKHQFHSLLQILGANMATEDTFVFCYWFCLLTALIAFSEAFNEFYNVYNDEQYIPKTYWNRDYRHIPVEYRRKARVAGAGVNIAVNLFFFYGFLNLRYPFILPWIIINAAILGLESFHWLTNAIRTKTIAWRTLLSLTFLMIRFAIIAAVTSTIADLE